MKRLIRTCYLGKPPWILEIVGALVVLSVLVEFGLALQGINGPLGLLHRDDPPYAEYLDVAICPEWDKRLGESPPDTDIASALVLRREVIEHLTPPPELRILHENWLKGLQLQLEAWQQQDGGKLSERARWYSHRDADLSPEIEQAISLYCEPRWDEYGRPAVFWWTAHLEGVE
ncbi:MAG: hypothetical protein F4X54_03435 [Chloroflexi bacterium]|nr:hypothetical protein [Chloroflexota bacterium]